jgi:predicted choloylglycine hydrolase
MRKNFVFEREDRPGEAWRERFAAGRAEAERWYLGAGLAAPAAAEACRAALVRHMPELVAGYDRVCGLVGDDAMAHRILSHWRPGREVHGCSQTVWLGEGGPALVRNYDYPLAVVSDRFELTAWRELRVICKAQRPWGGCLDGMNEDGLVASLTHGGGAAVGEGFSIILMLRYVLETCGRVGEAVAALRGIPVAQAQNVVLLDRTGAHATVFLGPGREMRVTADLTCANHQEVVPATGNSGLRQAAMADALAERGMTLAALEGRFFEAPLYARRVDFTTVYTAVYRPAEGRVDYCWPGRRWRQGFGRFEEGGYAHDYGALAP